jgi:hypothetical protein
MTRLQVADEEDSHQLWSKQLRAADKGWSSSLVLDTGLTTPHRKNTFKKLRIDHQP